MNRSIARAAFLRAFSCILFSCGTITRADNSPPVFVYAQQLQRITGADTDHGDQFGVASAIDGTTAIVGAYWDDDHGETSGSAYIFQQGQEERRQWGQIKKLNAGDGTAGDWFGVAVDISGDFAVVGAALHDEIGDNAGAAYVFYRHAGGSNQWGQVQKLTASNASPNDWFGWAVSISGSNIAVGAYRRNANGAESGAAYVFQADPANNHWMEIARLAPESVVAGAWFGWSVSLDEGSLIVGAPLASPHGASSGDAYVFQRDQDGVNAWGLERRLMRMPVNAGDQFGWSVALHGSTAAVGSRFANTFTNDTGAVFLFDRHQDGSSQWGQVQRVVADDVVSGDWFGEAIALHNDTLLVGVRLNDDLGNASGSAYLFHRNAGTSNQWGQVAKLLAADGGPEHRFGESVALAASSMLIGAFPNDMPGFGFAAGAAYIFRYGWAPRLTVSGSPDPVLISWNPPEAGWILQHRSLAEPFTWLDVPGATNPPFNWPTTGAGELFRLRLISP